MKQALEAWLKAAARGADHVESCRAAAEAVASDPWAVVEQAGALARATPDIAPDDLWLDSRLRARPCSTKDRGSDVHEAPEGTAVLPLRRRGRWREAPEGEDSRVTFVPRGAPYPRLDAAGKKRRGAFDTPRDMVRRVIAMAGEGNSARDIACGTGAFLVALAESGLSWVEGIDQDPAALAVASVAAPHARLILGDGLAPRDPVDLVVGNPPFIPPERQDKILRRALQRRFPWIVGRFDLAVPFAAVALDQVRTGGGLGLVIPWGLLTQPYATPLRRQWLTQHAIVGLEGPIRFPGAMVEVALLGLRAGATPVRLPSGVEPAELLTLASCPLDPSIQPGDAAMVARIRAESIELGDIAEIDTGVVSHGPHGGKANLIFDEPGEGRVPYVDAQDLIDGRVRWLQYAPEKMHRAKRPWLFEGPKLLVQRLRGAGPLRVWIDHTGLYAGHTLTVVRPVDRRVDVETIFEHLTSPEVERLLRIECGRRLDVYPRDIRQLPAPKHWLDGVLAKTA
jgi:hypothetical protein